MPGAVRAPAWESARATGLYPTLTVTAGRGRKAKSTPVAVASPGGGPAPGFLVSSSLSSVGGGEGQESAFLTDFPGGADAADLETTLYESLISTDRRRH